eukprot:CAMPEP_0174739696 /NCGR_PEP_ID=MMETSP1094-20130205/72036_1 /TAXON_ID=156173 /ORGANISM="Chrysochromulina brevifilum, Strain UTEX LB 985" /LENGTH=141 /DNA_ID=CAMNT_0015943285 /DNA_START=1089 /DNA_END=1510 /DNA_ORIENTATION=+
MGSFQIPIVSGPASVSEKMLAVDLPGASSHFVCCQASLTAPGGTHGSPSCTASFTPSATPPGTTSSGNCCQASSGAPGGIQGLSGGPEYNACGGNGSPWGRLTSGGVAFHPVSAPGGSQWLESGVSGCGGGGSSVGVTSGG